MRRINLPLLLDTLFAALCTFLLFFTTVRYYTKNVAIALSLAIAACVVFGALVFIYIRGKQDKKLLLSRDEKHKKLLSLHLSLSADTYVLNLFKNCLGEGAYVRGGKVIKDNTTYFFNFKMSPLTEDDVARVIKFKGRPAREKALFCTRLSPEAAVLCENFNIAVTDGIGTFKLLKDNNLLPEKYVYEDPPKKSFLKRVRTRFTRKLCAPLFWSGIALLALSYFTFFPAYYIIAGGLLLLLSALSLVFN